MWQLKTAYIYHLIFSLSQESRHDLAGFSISGSLFRAAIKELAKTRVSSEGNLGNTLFLRSLTNYWQNIIPCEL